MVVADPKETSKTQNGIRNFAGYFVDHNAFD